MSYRVTVSVKAEKEMMRLSLQGRKKIVNKIDLLADEPRTSGCLKLKGKNEELWRIRSGNYRIRYAIEEDVRIVDVRRVGDRKSIYR